MMGIKLDIIYKTFKIYNSNDHVESLLKQLFENNNIILQNYQNIYKLLILMLIKNPDERVTF